MGSQVHLLVSPLVWQCESIVEEYEDELIEFFSREADNVKDKLCSKRTGEFLPGSTPPLPALCTWVATCSGGAAGEQG